jgi:hypothetical protein
VPLTRPQLLSKQHISREGLSQGISQEGFDLAVGHGDDSVVIFSHRGNLAKVLERNITSGPDNLLKPLKIYVLE